ncbi:MAG: MotA/TolQ/ExbB proton channel family protein [Verrucomicrobiae bacterium]|nr:MotA/TolQ/ExbB proton channel family protein [Verrucomicrobiae bacterium]
MSTVLVMLLGSLAAPASGPEMVAVTAQADLQAALNELNEVRQQVEAERLPLTRRLRELEEQVLTKRRELERAQRFHENQLVELNALKAEVKRRHDEVKFISALLAEYARAFEARIHVSEVARFNGIVDAAQQAADSRELSEAERLAQQGALLAQSLARLEDALGGVRFAGRALAPSGRLERGQFALIGPVALFASDESPAAGVVELQLGSAEPTVLAVPTEFVATVRELTRAGAAEFPFDATLGNALKISAARDDLWTHIKKGGPVMVPILLLGLAALTIFVTRWIALSHIRVATPTDLQVILSALRRGDRSKAVAVASGIGGPVGDMLHAGIDHCHEQKEYIEEVMYEKMLATRPKLERLVPFLALSAAAAPLLGLLGTVTGMINTFNMITIFGAGDPKTLAGGISEALITTEFGLIVAIPSLLLHAVLTRRVKSVLANMEQTAVAFINGLPSNGETTQVLATKREV